MGGVSRSGGGGGGGGGGEHMFVRLAPALGNGRRNVLMSPVIGKHQYICMITVAASKQAAN